MALNKQLSKNTTATHPGTLEEKGIKPLRDCCGRGRGKSGERTDRDTTNVFINLWSIPTSFDLKQIWDQPQTKA